MPSSKSVLVALREYHENLRTKTFWLGILVFPTMLLVAAVVPKLLEKAKDIRKYAVLDHSRWLLPAIEDRATYYDTQRIFEHVREVASRGNDAVATLPTVLRGLALELRDATDAQVEKMARAMVLQGKGATERLEWPSIDSKLQGEFLLWLLEEAGQLGIGLDSERYQRVEIPPYADPEQWLRERLDRGELFAFFVIGPEPLDVGQGHRYVSNNRTDDDLKNWVARLASAELEARRLERERIDPETARSIQRPLVFEERQLSIAGEETAVEQQDIVRQWAPVAFVYLLWISIFTTAQLLVTNTIEEKSNRVVEVLLSSISPMQLMVGKVLGIAATGMTTIGSWIVCFLVFLKFLPRMLDVPADLDLMILVRDPVFVASFATYFLLGFLLYASLLVGMGSACNSLKEAQNLLAPILVLLMLPLISLTVISQDPNGRLAVTLSYIPPFTPFVMMNRAAGRPEAWEYATTTALLVVSIVITFWAAARVFRVGILMTGKPPRLLDLWRCLRTH